MAASYSDAFCESILDADDQDWSLAPRPWSCYCHHQNAKQKGINRSVHSMLFYYYQGMTKLRSIYMFCPF
jgi:hypothetical protein